jgi:general secretion pathway protein G
MTANGWFTLPSRNRTALYALALGCTLVLRHFMLVVPEMHFRNRSFRAVAGIQLSLFADALEGYAKDNGHPPSEAQGLLALVAKPTLRPKPRVWKVYIAGSTIIPKDPWGNEYVYQRPDPDGHRFEVLSYGTDEKPGGTGDDADIVVTH